MKLRYKFMGFDGKVKAVIKAIEKGEFQTVAEIQASEPHMSVLSAAARCIVSEPSAYKGKPTFENMLKISSEVSGDDLSKMLTIALETAFHLQKDALASDKILTAANKNGATVGDLTCRMTVALGQGMNEDLLNVLVKHGADADKAVADFAQRVAGKTAELQGKLNDAKSKYSAPASTNTPDQLGSGIKNI